MESLEEVAGGVVGVVVVGVVVGLVVVSGRVLHVVSMSTKHSRV